METICVDVVLPRQLPMSDGAMEAAACLRRVSNAEHCCCIVDSRLSTFGQPGINRPGMARDRSGVPPCRRGSPVEVRRVAARGNATGGLACPDTASGRPHHRARPRARKQAEPAGCGGPAGGSERSGLGHRDPKTTYPAAVPPRPHRTQARTAADGTHCARPRPGPGGPAGRGDGHGAASGQDRARSRFAERASG